jgi:hypothetical protein
MLMRLALVASAAAVSVAAVTPAQAHAVSASGLLYKSIDLCTRGVVSQVHRSPDGQGGWIAAVTTSQTRNIGSPVVYCSIPWSRPALNIRVNLNWLVWAYNGSGYVWSICRQTGWVFNRYASISLKLEVLYAAPPCGNAWYLANTLHGVANSGWYGGQLAPSDSHWYPDYSKKAATPAPTVPAALPSLLPLAGPDGRVQRAADGTPIMVNAVPTPDKVSTGPADRTTHTDPDGSVHEVVVMRE